MMTNFGSSRPLTVRRISLIARQIEVEKFSRKSEARQAVVTGKGVGALRNLMRAYSKGQFSTSEKEKGFFGCVSDSLKELSGRLTAFSDLSSKVVTRLNGLLQEGASRLASLDKVDSGTPITRETLQVRQQQLVANFAEIRNLFKNPGFKAKPGSVEAALLGGVKRALLELAVEIDRLGHHLELPEIKQSLLSLPSFGEQEVIAPGQPFDKFPHAFTTTIAQIVKEDELCTPQAFGKLKELCQALKKGPAAIAQEGQYTTILENAFIRAGGKKEDFPNAVNVLLGRAYISLAEKCLKEREFVNLDTSDLSLIASKYLAEQSLAELKKLADQQNADAKEILDRQMEKNKTSENFAQTSFNNLDSLLTQKDTRIKTLEKEIDDLKQQLDTYRMLPKTDVKQEAPAKAPEPPVKKSGGFSFFQGVKKAFGSVKNVADSVVKTVGEKAKETLQKVGNNTIYKSKIQALDNQLQEKDRLLRKLTEDRDNLRLQQTQSTNQLNALKKLDVVNALYASLQETIENLYNKGLDALKETAHPQDVENFRKQVEAGREKAIKAIETVKTAKNTEEARKAAEAVIAELSKTEVVVSEAKTWSPNLKSLGFVIGRLMPQVQSAIQNMAKSLSANTANAAVAFIVKMLNHSLGQDKVPLGLVDALTPYYKDDILPADEPKIIDAIKAWARGLIRCFRVMPAQLEASEGRTFAEPTIENVNEAGQKKNFVFQHQNTCFAVSFVNSLLLTPAGQGIFKNGLVKNQDGSYTFKTISNHLEEVLRKRWQDAEKINDPEHQDLAKLYRTYLTQYQAMCRSGLTIKKEDIDKMEGAFSDLEKALYLAHIQFGISTGRYVNEPMPKLGDQSSIEDIAALFGLQAENIILPAPDGLQPDRCEDLRMKAWAGAARALADNKPVVIRTGDAGGGHYMTVVGVKGSPLTGDCSFVVADSSAQGIREIQLDQRLAVFVFDENPVDILTVSNQILPTYQSQSSERVLQRLRSHFSLTLNETDIDQVLLDDTKELAKSNVANPAPKVMNTPPNLNKNNKQLELDLIKNLLVTGGGSACVDLISNRTRKRIFAQGVSSLITQLLRLETGAATGGLASVVTIGDYSVALATDAKNGELLVTITAKNGTRLATRERIVDSLGLGKTPHDLLALILSDVGLAKGLDFYQPVLTTILDQVRTSLMSEKGADFEQIAATLCQKVVESRLGETFVKGALQQMNGTLSARYLCQLAEEALAGTLTTKNFVSMITTSNPTFILSKNVSQEMVTFKSIPESAPNVSFAANVLPSDKPSDRARDFVADLVYTATSWLYDQGTDDLTRLKTIAARYADVLEAIQKGTVKLDAADLVLPAEAKEALKTLIEAIQGKKDDEITAAYTNFMAPIKSFGGNLEAELLKLFQNNLTKTVDVKTRRGSRDDFDLGLKGASSQGQKGMLKGLYGKFFSRAIGIYFKGVSEIDRLRMVSAAIRYAKTEKESLGAFLKGMGPVMQKMLQGLPGDFGTLEMRAAIADMKSRLTPIPREFVAARLQRMVNESKKAYPKDTSKQIAKIDVLTSMGRATIGETFLCKLTYADGSNAEVVLKMLRPEAKNSALRERDVFFEAAREIPGMRGNFRGQINQIMTELDFTQEAKNVIAGDRAYNTAGNKTNHVGSNVLAKGFEPTNDLLALQKVEGSTIDRFIEDLDRELSDMMGQCFELDEFGKPKMIKPSKYSSPVPIVRKDVGLFGWQKALSLRSKIPLLYNKLAAVQKLMLHAAKTWIEEAFFKGGTVHNDPHSGNLMVDIKVNEMNVVTSGELNFIDYGNAGNIKKYQSNIGKMLAMTQINEPGDFIRHFMENMDPTSQEYRVLNRLQCEYEIKRYEGVKLLDDPTLAQPLNEKNEAPYSVSNYSDDVRLLERYFSTFKVEGRSRAEKFNALNTIYQANKDKKDLPPTPLTEEVWKNISDVNARLEKFESRNKVVILGVRAMNEATQKETIEGYTDADYKNDMKVLQRYFKQFNAEGDTTQAKMEALEHRYQQRDGIDEKTWVEIVKIFNERVSKYENLLERKKKWKDAEEIDGRQYKLAKAELVKIQQEEAKRLATESGGNEDLLAILKKESDDVYNRIKRGFDKIVKILADSKGPGATLAESLSALHDAGIPIPSDIFNMTQASVRLEATIDKLIAIMESIKASSNTFTSGDYQSFSKPSQYDCPVQLVNIVDGKNADGTAMDSDLSYQPSYYIYDDLQSMEKECTRERIAMSLLDGTPLITGWSSTKTLEEVTVKDALLDPAELKKILTPPSSFLSTMGTALNENEELRNLFETKIVQPINSGKYNLEGRTQEEILAVKKTCASDFYNFVLEASEKFAQHIRVNTEKILKSFAKPVKDEGQDQKSLSQLRDEQNVRLGEEGGLTFHTKVNGVMYVYNDAMIEKAVKEGRFSRAGTYKPLQFSPPKSFYGMMNDVMEDHKDDIKKYMGVGNALGVLKTGLEAVFSNNRMVDLAKKHGLI